MSVGTCRRESPSIFSLCSQCGADILVVETDGCDLCARCATRTIEALEHRSDELYVVEAQQPHRRRRVFVVLSESEADAIQRARSMLGGTHDAWRYLVWSAGEAVDLATLGRARP